MGRSLLRPLSGLQRFSSRAQLSALPWTVDPSGGPKTGLPAGTMSKQFTREFLRHDLDRLHHAVVLVIGDMAVIHELSDLHRIEKGQENGRGTAHGHDHDILASEERNRTAIAGSHLKVELVDMENVLLI